MSNIHHYRYASYCISILGLCLLLVTACGSSTNSSIPPTPTALATATSIPSILPTATATLSLVLPITAVPQGPPHQKGQVVNVGKLWQVVLTSVKISTGDAVTQPKSGDTIIVLDLRLKNISSQPLLVSSVASFFLQDSTGRHYGEAFVVSNVKPPDGQVQAGASLDGRLTYEVPLAQHKYTLVFIGDLTDTTNSNVVAWDVNL